MSQQQKIIKLKNRKNIQVQRQNLKSSLWLSLNLPNNLNKTKNATINNIGST